MIQILNLFELLEISRKKKRGLIFCTSFHLHHQNKKSQLNWPKNFQLSSNLSPIFHKKPQSTTNSILFFTILARNQTKSNTSQEKTSLKVNHSRG